MRVAAAQSISKRTGVIVHKVVRSVCTLKVCVLTVFILTVFVLVGCTSPTPPRIKPVTRELAQLIKALPRDEITRDATQILTRLIQAKSVHPPGDEVLVVDLIDSLAREVGLTARRRAITTQRVDKRVDKRVDNRRRENIYVILEPQNSREAHPTAPELVNPKLETLCLLSHSDVVPAAAGADSAPDEDIVVNVHRNIQKMPRIAATSSIGNSIVRICQVASAAFGVKAQPTEVEAADIMHIVVQDVRINGR